MNKELQEFITASLNIYELAALFNHESDSIWVDAKKEFFDSYEKLTGEKLKEI